MHIVLDEVNSQRFEDWWDQNYTNYDEGYGYPPCNATDCNVCNQRKNEWIDELYDQQVTEYVPVPEIDLQMVMIEPLDAIVITNILTSLLSSLIDNAETEIKNSPEWLTNYLAVGGLRAIHATLHNKVKGIDVDSLITPGA